MIKVLKKNQVIFATLGLTLIVAGYLNYINVPELKYQTELTGKIEENVGDTIYVKNEEINDVIPVVSIQNESTDEYFINAKMERNNMFDEQIDTYKEILENSQVDSAQKEKAQAQIEEISTNKNSIMIAENLILLKEIENVVILTNKESVNVIVKSENELDKDKVAQIYSIVSRELNVDSKNVQILLKK